MTIIYILQLIYISFMTSIQNILTINGIKEKEVSCGNIDPWWIKCLGLIYSHSFNWIIYISEYKKADSTGPFDFTIIEWDIL